jgi:DinB superfamily
LEEQRSFKVHQALKRSLAFPFEIDHCEAIDMDIITKLETTRDRTLQYFDLSSKEFERRCGPGKWSVRFILHHLADSEAVLLERIRRTISESRPVLWAYNQDAWAKELDYDRMPLDLSRRIYEATRAGIIYLAGEHYDKSGHLEFIHSETGIRTLKDEFDKVAAHNQHHLEQIEMALAQPKRQAG